MKIEEDKLFIRIAKEVAGASYAEDKQVGAVIVNNGNIISFSYNGTPAGWDNHTERDGVTLPHTLHAEAQAIAKLARGKGGAEGATMYSTLSPCLECAKLIGEAGIKRLVYEEAYKYLTGVRHLQNKGVLVNEPESNTSLADPAWIKNHTGL